MVVPVERMIDGLVETLTGSILPAVTSRTARGQLFAVVDVLRNLRDRVEERTDLLREEADSAAAALGRAVVALREGGQGDGAERLAAAVAAAPAEPPAARVAALRQAYVVALEALPAGPSAARLALEGHLASQAMRDVTTLKPSMLSEISRGEGS